MIDAAVNPAFNATNATGLLVIPFISGLASVAPERSAVSVEYASYP